MTPSSPDQIAREIANKIVEKSRKRWIEETDEGFGCNLDILGKDIEYEIAAALREYGEACKEKGFLEGLNKQFEIQRLREKQVLDSCVQFLRNYYTADDVLYREKRGIAYCLADVMERTLSHSDGKGEGK